MSIYFDWEFYLEYYQDLKNNGIKTEKQAKRHYEKYGKKENRICNVNEVDQEFYYNKYLDIHQDKSIKKEKVYLHFLKYGIKEGRVPNKMFKIKSNENFLINILIRCSYRPFYFKKCIESILTQINKNFKIIICYDDERCMEYLQKYNEHEKISIYQAPNFDIKKSYFYNLYCNFLLEKVIDGWIMFLDDDDQLYHKNILNIIQNNIKTNNDVLFWKVKVGNKIIFQKNINNIHIDNFSGIGYCFNSIHKNKIKWVAEYRSDYKYLLDILNINKNISRKQINYILTKTQYYPKRQYGIEDSEVMEDIIKKFNIKQTCVSDSLIHLKNRFLKKYSLNLLHDKNNPALFFGVYNKDDIKNILDHSGLTFIILGGSDVPNIEYIKNKYNIRILSISQDIKTRLIKYNVYSCYVLFNLVDYSLFKPIPLEKRGRKVFVYNGIVKKDDNNKIYNQSIINNIVTKCKDKEFIFSNELNLEYEKMPTIYNQCYIGLRLTSHDGNANMVQEMQAMNIPVVHNNSNYGLKWNNIDDVIKYIYSYDIVPDLLSCNKKRILLNTHSNLNVIGGDTIMFSNLVNMLTKNKNKIYIITNYNYNIFEKNLIDKNKCKFISTNSENIVHYIDKISKKIDLIFIRNHLILYLLENKSYLYKTIFYGLNIHIPRIKKLNNMFLQIITQSEKLKNKFIDAGVLPQKINVIEPIVNKYNFELIKRNDNEIRLIYCGTLRDEENILEIIEEFQKIHKEQPKTFLKIVYGKIHGNQEFNNKIQNYIKNGVPGITFKNNLCHKDACCEIATCDIGLCWRKEGYGNDGEISTKVKEYEMYGLKILTNKFNCKSRNSILFFQNSKDFYNILINYDKYFIIKGNYKILYMANTSLPKISGYTIRTKYILKEINKYYPIICFVKPTNKHQQSVIYSIDNIIYYNYYNRENYQKFLENYITNSIIRFIWAASDNYNGIICGNIAKNLKLKSAYEIRGFWHYSRKYRESCENYFNEKFFNNYDIKEKKACLINDYILCENNNILNICNQKYEINKNKLFLLKNGVINVNEKKKIDLNKKSKITFGYIGSIVSYEGLTNFIDQFKKIVSQKYDIELIIVGGGETLDAIQTIDKINNLIKNIKNIKYVGNVPHNDVNKYYDLIDIICLPRIDCEVCNIVSPLKPYEAMMNGKVVFASSVNAICEIITHNYNGILFDKTDINDIKNKIEDILNKKFNLNNIIQNGYNYCKNNTWQDTCKNALKIIYYNI